MTYHNTTILSPTQLITTASQIINRLAEQNITDPASLDSEIPHYIEAKFAFISIAETCLSQAQPVATHFETELRARYINGTLSYHSFTILRWHLDIILAHYQQCCKQNQNQNQPQDTLNEKVLSQAALATEIDCAICLISHKKQDTLCIQSCQHEFGKTCLLEWQHVSKLCPLCRADAKKIHGYKARAKKTAV